MYNYGQLQVTFDDGSVGWYEAGWGPMMSETAFFVKDVIGPKGCVSIVKDPKEGDAAGSADIDSHTKTNCIRLHHGELDSQTNSPGPTSRSTPRTSRIIRGCAIASRRICCARSGTTSTSRITCRTRSTAWRSCWRRTRACAPVRSSRCDSQKEHELTGKRVFGAGRARKS